MRIPDGFGIIAGHGTEIAQRALAAADAAGVPQEVVVSIREGYLVPGAVLDKYNEALGDLPAAEETEAEDAGAPDDSWKNADIKEYADAHGIDLGEATKKADMLAVISAAQEKED